VVLENIFRYIEEKGYSPFQAAIEATREIGLAVMATTLSLVVIFLPTAFMPSIAGKFFKSISLTMAFAILVSLLVSFTLTPMLSSRLLKRLKRGRSNEDVPASSGNKLQAAAPKAAHHDSKDAFLFRFLDTNYTRLLTLSLRHRLMVTLLAFGVMLSIVPLFMFVGKDFFPQDDQDEFEVSLRAPEGTSLQKTLEIASRVGKDIRLLPSVKYTLTTIGDSPQRCPNLARIYVRLVPLADRKLTQFDVMGEMRSKVLPKYASDNLRAAVVPVSAIGGSSQQNADIAFMLQGP